MLRTCELAVRRGRGSNDEALVAHTHPSPSRPPHRIRKLNSTCAKEWQEHFECLERQNHELYLCRKPERTFNSCVFDKLGLKKEIPGTPEGKVPIHEKKDPIWKAMQR